MRVKRRFGGMPRFFGSLAFVLLMTACNIVPDRAVPTQINHLAMVYENAEDCRQAVATPAQPSQRGFAENGNLELLSWNIQKGSQPGWLDDLKQLASQAELVTLQEALLNEEIKSAFERRNSWSFSPGYQGDGYNSGVITVSQVAPDVVCSLQAIEPWLNTPKAASIARFPIKHSQQSILLVNMHVVNFAFGTEEFNRQVDSVARVVEAHGGPVVLSGDFNTWKNTRMRLLTEVTKKLGLETVEFTPDHRIQWFGNYLDYIFVRGFTVKNADSPAVTSSDHNPLRVTLVLSNLDTTQ